MASEPTVCCIMPTKDRPELAARAVRCFRAQAYERKTLVIINGGNRLVVRGLNPPCNESEFEALPYSPTIGRMRNAAVDVAIKRYSAEIIFHFDDDDVSHPNRIAEQVAFLQSSGAAVVGYSQMLFWNTWGQRIEIPDPEDVTKTMWVNSFDNRKYAEAWLYTGPAHQPLGTSLCYWRKTWESHRFDDRKHAGEDTDFLARVGHRRVKSVTSICSCREHVSVSLTPYETLVARLNEANATDLTPRMIATVHGANTQQKTYDGFFKGGTVEMKRVAEWDDRVRNVLEGA